MESNHFPNNRLKFVSLVIVILFFHASQAFLRASDSLSFKRVIVTTSVLSYIPTLQLNTGTFNLGTEVYLANRNSMYANFGFIQSYGSSRGYFSISSESTQGFKVQLEGRHYLGRTRIFDPAVLLFWPHIFQYKSESLANAGYYTALNSFYQWTTTDREEQQNPYTVDRNAVGLQFRFGYQSIKKYGLVVDYSVGVGGQYISSHSTNQLGDDAQYPNNDKEWNGRLFDHGSGWYPTLIYQVSLGW